MDIPTFGEEQEEPDFDLDLDDDSPSWIEPFDPVLDD